jgi:phospholipase/carboxylesterase
MTSILSHITMDTGKNPRHSIIWLHGLGADGQDFVTIVELSNSVSALQFSNFTSALRLLY